MSDRSTNAYYKKARQFKHRVWFNGDTALLKGQGVCYDYDYGTATSNDGRRSTRVELPSTTNARHFAGVADRSYSAVTGGQFIYIYEPGSDCEILLMADVVIDTSVITCQAGGTYAGYFTRAGFPGKGSAEPLQTVSAASDADQCLAHLQEGPQSGLVEVVTPDTDGGATSLMVGGVSYVAASALDTAHATDTLADHTVVGARKGVVCEGDLGDSYDFVLTVTHGLQNDGDTAYASFTFDDDGDFTYLEWNGIWRELYSAGGTVG
jgi:hypothetical protein